MTGTRRTTWAVVVGAFLVYAYAWAVQPNRPEVTAVVDPPGSLFVVAESGFTAPPSDTEATLEQAKRYGWYGMWYDQYHYGQMARALARFDLPGTAWDEEAGVPASGSPTFTSVASYAYGLGYPILAAPFVWLGFGGDPYVILNGLLFALSAFLALRIGRQVVSEPAAVVAVIALVTAAPFVRYFVIPNSTSVTVVAVLAATWMLVAPRPTRADIALAASTAALCAAARYVDGAWPALLLGGSVLLRRPKAVRTALLTGGTLLVTVLLVALTHRLAFGSILETPYHFHNDGLDTSDVAYSLGRIPSSFIGVFFSGQRKELFGVDPIIRAAPWMLLAPWGLIGLWRDRHPLRGPLAVAAAVAALATAQYCAWLFGGIANLRLFNIRFYHSWFALYAVLAAAALERALVRPDRPDRS